MCGLHAEQGCIQNWVHHKEPKTWYSVPITLAKKFIEHMLYIQPWIIIITVEAEHSLERHAFFPMDWNGAAGENTVSIRVFLLTKTCIYLLTLVNILIIWYWIMSIVSVTNLYLSGWQNNIDNNCLRNWRYQKKVVHTHTSSSKVNARVSLKQIKSFILVSVTLG